ncbi:MAG: TolC family protein [Muribaculaceae bacterium]|nr:TolC family protein [Muribaculaceae bacterium]
MKRIYILFMLVILLSVPMAPLRGQTVTLTLGEAIARARTSSLDAAVALDQLRAAYWEHRSYRASLLPEITFKGTLPSYHKQYSPYMNQDGEYSFVANHYMQLSGEISVTQSIWPTGGTLGLTTSLDYLRQFSGQPYNRFMSIPVALTLSQPIFGVNHTKWNRRIEPTRYREAQAEFLSATEDVAITAIQLYFSMLMDRENLSIARENLSHAERLHAVAIEKRDMGQISKNDLLQMELNLLDAQSALTDCESALRTSTFRLQTFLDLEDSGELLPEVPDMLPNVEIPFGEAYDKALANNKLALSMARRRMEADYAVAQAKGDRRSINLYAQVGFTGSAHTVGGAYNPLKDNQLIEIGFEIPLLDWGRREGKVKVAESARDVTATGLRQEAQTFRQDLYVIVERYANQQRQLEIAARADTISARRYATNVETFMTGRISTLNLNDSRSQKDEARRAFINELYLFWLYYYQIRSLTLWDFASGTPIEADMEKMIKFAK